MVWRPVVQRAWLWASVVSLLALSWTGSAHALGRVLGSDQGAPEVDGLRVLVAQAPTRTTLWVSYRLAGPAQPVAVVLPVEPGAVVDPVSDAWFEALEDATAPRVLAPSGYSPTNCGPTTRAGSVDDTAQAVHQPTLPPAGVAVLSAIDDLTAYAQSKGFALGADDQRALKSVGGPFLVLVYDLPGEKALTQTVRIVEPPTASLPLALAHPSLGAPVPLTLWVIGAGRARIDNELELSPDDLKVVWRAADATSNYASALRQALADRGAATWVLEASGTAPLYQWTPLPGTQSTIAPAVTGYLERAQTLGDVSQDPVDCQSAIDSARNSAAPDEKVSPACPAGALARVADPSASFSACPVQATDALDPASFVCDRADDLAFALSGLDPNAAWLTRETGWLADGSSAASQLAVVNGSSRSPLVQTTSVDFTGCTGAGGSEGSGGSTSNWGSGGSGWGSGGYGAPTMGAGGGSSLGGVDPYGSSDSSSQSTVDATVSCFGSTQPDSSSSCSGDSSSSSSNSGSSCSGDSSSSSSNSGSSCSGDSSGSSSNSGATCSGDSSGSSSNSGATCSGDSSGNSGATCSGDSGGSSGCSLVRPHGHPRMSALTLACAGVLFPLRRIRRPGRARRRRR